MKLINMSQAAQISGGYTLTEKGKVFEVNADGINTDCFELFKLMNMVADSRLFTKEESHRFLINDLIKMKDLGCNPEEVANRYVEGLAKIK